MPSFTPIGKTTIRVNFPINDDQNEMPSTIFEDNLNLNEKLILNCKMVCQMVWNTYKRAHMRMTKELINDRMFRPVKGMCAQRINTTVKIPE